jgi:hypothetical protein
MSKPERQVSISGYQRNPIGAVIRMKTACSSQMSLKAPRFSTSPTETARYLERLQDLDALGMPLLGEPARLSLLKAAEGLSYRQAQPYLGAKGKEVRQDFEICMEFGSNETFTGLAGSLAEHLLAASQSLAAPPLTEPLRFNDIAVQRYRPGSDGIAPHRDFLQFRQIVVLIILTGQGRFFVCDNREGREATEVPLRPGDALLMQAPGFGGQNRRPFHFLRDITERRVIVGLRYESKLAEPAKG